MASKSSLNTQTTQTRKFVTSGTNLGGLYKEGESSTSSTTIVHSTDEAELTELNDKLEYYVSVVSDKIKKRHDGEHHWQKTIDRLKSEKEDIRTSYQNQLADIQVQLQREKESHADTIHRRQQDLIQLKDLDARLVWEVSKSKNLDEKLAEKTAELEDLRKKYGTLEFQHSDLNRRFTEISAHEKDLKRKNEGLERKVLELEKQTSVLQSNLDDVNRERDIAQQEAKRLMLALADISGDASDTVRNEREAHFRGIYANLKADLDKEKERIAKLLEDKTRYETDSQVWQTQLARAREENVALKDQIGGLMGDLKAAQSATEKLTIEISSIKNRSTYDDNLREERDRAVAEAEQLKRHIVNLNDRLNSLFKDDGASSLDRGTLLENLAKANQANLTLAAEITQLKAQIASLDPTVKKQAAHIANLQNLLNQARELQRENAQEVQVEYVKIQSELREKESEIRRVKENNFTLKAEIDHFRKLVEQAEETVGVKRARNNYGYASDSSSSDSGSNRSPYTTTTSSGSSGSSVTVTSPAAPRVPFTSAGSSAAVTSPAAPRAPFTSTGSYESYESYESSGSSAAVPRVSITSAGSTTGSAIDSTIEFSPLEITVNTDNIVIKNVTDAPFNISSHRLKSVAYSTTKGRRVASTFEFPSNFILAAGQSVTVRVAPELPAGSTDLLWKKNIAPWNMDTYYIRLVEKENNITIAEATTPLALAQMSTFSDVRESIYSSSPSRRVQDQNQKDCLIM